MDNVHVNLTGKKTDGIKIYHQQLCMPGLLGSANPHVIISSYYEAAFIVIVMKLSRILKDFCSININAIFCHSIIWVMQSWLQYRYFIMIFTR